MIIADVGFRSVHEITLTIIRGAGLQPVFLKAA